MSTNMWQAITFIDKVQVLWRHMALQRVSPGPRVCDYRFKYMIQIIG